MTTRSLIVARRTRRQSDTTERSVLSLHDRRRPVVRWIVAVAGVLVVLGLVAVSIGPLFWLFKASTSLTVETLANPFAIWPSGFHWDNYVEAFARIEFWRYLLNTLWVCIGSWFASLLIATTGGYVLAVLRPSYARLLEGAVLVTLFVPSVVSLVGLYLTVVDVPLVGVNLINTFWAVWLPSAASAFNLILAQRFFRALPREIFEAAEVDGAGPLRIFVSIVLPLSRPIIGVISLLAIISAYKDFLWPKLVLPADSVQPLSVALPRLEAATDLSVFLAALFASVVVPIVAFLLFQRQFLSAAGSSGAIKD